ncbi:hypothetical protein LHFGNBLO_000727 [Mesorhizobium sp. AR10]|uniref:hypothetical protein n=1 Tax=Mesorhizobium sp. AR10 TaxID=2865839 RepID=UPI0021601897|nr:hypothetical protein [Mesorhizobium sp. AR10]UVK39367.1 hypothetical protein LHFGNBLO_000727 [Mesorhizobium sp. AR10]
MAKRSTLALVAAGVGSAAVAGYGLSIGRDLWKTTKRSQGVIIVAIALFGAVALPVVGGRGLVRGHDRGPIAGLLITFVGSVCLILVGFGLAFCLLGYLTYDETLPNAGLHATALVCAAITGAFAAIGMMWGAVQRPSRLRTFAVSKANQQFLDNIGFKETGGEDITHYDPSGQALRLLEHHKDRLVFMAVGRRGKRAFIDLDAAGQMTGYSGIS